jgi:membrane protein implicated in regulation of membrane protease activity
MASYWIWWIVAGVLVVAELVSGSFFLLALAVAFAAGGVTALLGGPFELQLLAATILAVAGVFIAHRTRQRARTGDGEPAFDIGQAVRVQAWNADGTARVAYRGTLWQAEPASPDTPRGETMYIVAMRGSTLVIADRRP